MHARKPHTRGWGGKELCAGERNAPAAYRGPQWCSCQVLGRPCGDPKNDAGSLLPRYTTRHLRVVRTLPISNKEKETQGILHVPHCVRWGTILACMQTPSFLLPVVCAVEPGHLGAFN
eukprot:1152166-Pelagomonas_calceolata.AAC.1